MFDHCDSNTTAIVDSALDEARRLGHNHLGTEHLLVALSRHRGVLPDAVAGLLPSPEALLSRVTKDIAAPAQRDAALLRAVGIDLDQVRAAVRRTFGDEAVAQLGHRRVHQPWQPWRRPSRRCTSLLAGTMSVAPRVKRSFELARRHAEAANAGIDPARLLRAMLGVEDAMSNRLLVEAGVDLAELRRRLST